MVTGSLSSQAIIKLLKVDGIVAVDVIACGDDT
jgi:hypothetical protein